MLLLAVETSSSRGSLALINSESPSETLAESHWLRERSHSEIIIEAYEKILKDSHLKKEDIDAYAVGIGPGSFTGIRVGLNFVRSLAYCFKKPVYSLESLSLFKPPLLEEGQLTITLINAFRNLIYCAGYEKQGSHMVQWLEPQALTTAELEEKLFHHSSGPFFCLGNGFANFQSQMSPDLLKALKPLGDEFLYPQADVLAALILQDPRRATLCAWNEVKPLYIRASEAEEKLRRN